MTEEKMRKIALDVIRLPTYTEVIKENHISKKTFYELQKDPDFVEILREIRVETWENAINTIMGNVEDSVKILVEIMKDPKASPNARIKAANSILNRGAEYYEDVNILDRIENLEELAESNKE